MSEKRLILHAKRHTKRVAGNSGRYSENIHIGAPYESVTSLKEYARRDSKTPKNLANNRLKKLRDSLGDEVAREKHANERVNPIIPDGSYIGNARGTKRSYKFKDENPSSSKVCRPNQPTSTRTSGFKFYNSTYQKLTRDDSDEAMECSSSTLSIPSTSNTRNTGICTNEVIIVVDTNIFVSEVQIISNIINMRTTGTKEPIIFIPWIVMEELDYMKDYSHKDALKTKAQAAIKFINSTITSDIRRMKGQTLEEANEQKESGKSQDNKIISCCLQVCANNQNMVLLTNDINLRNKAIINNMNTCSSKDIMNILSAKFNGSAKADVILEKMTDLCCIIILKCAKDAYGSVWNKMESFKKPPATIFDCIHIFRRYWGTIFHEVLLKQFKKAIEDLSDFLDQHSNITNDSSELHELVRLCIRTCLFLKDVEQHKNLIETTIKELTILKKS